MNNRALVYLGYTMALFYCVAGVSFISYGERFMDMPDWGRLLTGCLLILYGAFRFIRSRNLSKKI